MGVEELHKSPGALVDLSVEFEHEICAARVGNGDAELVCIPRHLHGLVAHAVTEGERSRCRLGGTIDPVEKQAIWAPVGCIPRLRSTDPQPVRSAAGKREPVRKLSQQARVRAHALHRREYRVAAIEHLESQGRL